MSNKARAQLLAVLSLARKRRGALPVKFLMPATQPATSRTRLVCGTLLRFTREYERDVDEVRRSVVEGDSSTRVKPVDRGLLRPTGNVRDEFLDFG